MIKLTNLITEQKFEYGCAMLYFKFPKDILELQSKIDKDDIYTEKGDRTYGIETEPHLTLLFGLHKEVTVKDIEAILDRFNFTPLTLFNPSAFRNPKYDVLKIDVSNKMIYDVNAELQKLPFTSEFPAYHPHATIAYLKPDTSDKYADMISGYTWKVIPEYAVYSEPNGKQTKIQI